MNSMIYTQGALSDNDRWAGRGCTGWGHGDALPHFRNSENDLLGQDGAPAAGHPTLR